MQFECSMILQGTLGGKFDIFAASGVSIAWVLLWTTRSRPIGVRECPIAQINFFRSAFDPRAWTMVVFRKEDSRRQPHLITPENEGGVNTNYQSPPNVTFLNDPEIPFGLQGPQPLAPPEPHQPPGPPGPLGIPPGWRYTARLASSSITSRWYRKSWNRKYIAWAITPRILDLHRMSLNLFQY